MTNPNQEDAQLPNLSDDYIRDLEPDNQRYDITLAQDFVISVLPNGIKTWAFIYDFQGRNRRKTLGVFPEMNFEDAKVALEKARASMLRMDEPTVAPNEFGQLPAVLGGGRYIPKGEKKPFNFGLWVKFFAALLAVSAIVFVVAKKPDWRSMLPSNNESGIETAPSAPLPFAVDKSLNTSAPSIATNESTPNRSQAASSTTSKPKPKPKPIPARVTPSTPTQMPVTPSSVSTTAPTNTPATTRTTRAEVNQTSTTQPRIDTRPVTSLTTTSSATAFGGRVALSRLTSRVQDLQPVDTLGPEIFYKNSGFTRVFYYTVLREFSDGNVVHRWSLNGEIKEEVVLKVKPSWGWRTYSNKDITPGLNGEWKVETIDATGKILDTETFTYDYQ